MLRRAAVAGSWYPGRADALAAELDAHLGAVPSQNVPGALVALVSPHAGLRYSGPVAAYGYSLLRGREGLTAVLVGPSHRRRFEGVAVVAEGAFETPLGKAPIDAPLASALVAAGVVDDVDPHRGEHSLEMQLPFLQHAIPGLKIVPLLMGSQSREEVAFLADALASALHGRTVLLVASSDLSHYEPAPVASRLDAQVVERVRAFDPDALMDLLESEPRHACGGGPMVAVLSAARRLGANHAAVLRYADSGDVPGGDKSRVVGYLSAALCRA